MSTLTDLLEDHAKLERQIAEARNASRAEAIAEIRALMTQNGLTAADFAGKAAPASGTRPRSKVAAKYRDPESGATWSGRGLTPRWLVARLATGRQLNDFAI